MYYKVTVESDQERHYVGADMFGSNILSGTNTADGQPLGDFVNSVDQVGATRLRYPAGRAEEKEITKLVSDASGTDKLNFDLRTYLDWVMETNTQTTLVVPSVNLSDTQIAEMTEWAELVKQYMGEKINLVTAFEIGNEYWGYVGEDSYGQSASKIAIALREAALGEDMPGVWIQTANVVGGSSNYKGSDNGSISAEEAINALSHLDGVERPADWSADMSSADFYYSLNTFEQRILEANLELMQEFDADRDISNGFQQGTASLAFDGIVAHYYYDGFHREFDASFEDFRDQTNNLELRFSPWTGLIESNLSIQVTEWNVESDHSFDLGMKSAGTLIDMFENMLQLGVDGADFWAMRHNTASAAAGSHNDTNDVRLTPSGAILKYMKESLVDGASGPLYLVDAQGYGGNIVDVTVFQGSYKTVLYVASRSDLFNQDVLLDLSDLAHGVKSWSGRKISIDAATSDGMSDNRALDENGDIVSRLPRRPIDQNEADALRDVLGDAFQESFIKIVSGQMRTYLPESSGILVRPGITSPSSLDDFYFASEADVKSIEESLTQSDLGHSLSNISLAFDPYEVFEITIDHSWLQQGNDQSDVLIGSIGFDVILGEGGDDILSGFLGNDLIKGQLGNDAISLGGGDDKAFGGWGNDTIEGGYGADWIDGGGDNDKILGGAQSDVVFGGYGDDTVYGGNGADLAYLNVGDDVFEDNEQNANDTVWGGWGSDTISGGHGNDLLSGDWGGDVLDGGLGHDEIFGGSGNDVIIGGSGRDTVDGGTGRDQVFLGLGDDYFTDDNETGLLGTDTVYGGWGSDTIVGFGGDDLFFGDGGNDMILGGSGNDTLEGGAGHDTLSGGADVDTFVFRENFGSDTILDFSQGEDRIVLSQDIFTEFLDAQSIVANFGNHYSGQFLLTFGNGQAISFAGSINLEALYLDIDVV